MGNVNVSLAALADVYSALKEFQKNIGDLPKDVSADISSLIYACENEIDIVNTKLKRLEQEKNNLEISLQNAKKSIIFCESQIAGAEGEISALQAALYNISDSVPDAKEKADGIHSQIFFLESKTAELRNNMYLYERERDGIFYDLSQKIKEIDWTRNKLSKINRAFSDVQSSSRSLKAMVNNFCLRASQVSGANASSVALCIDCLEEYMNTNL